VQLAKEIVMQLPPSMGSRMLSASILIAAATMFFGSEILTAQAQ